MRRNWWIVVWIIAPPTVGLIDILWWLRRCCGG
jgi:hypothetical protein